MRVSTPAAVVRCPTLPVALSSQVPARGATVHVASDARTAVASAEGYQFFKLILPRTHKARTPQAIRTFFFCVLPRIRTCLENTERAARTHTPDANMASGFGA